MNVVVLHASSVNFIKIQDIFSRQLLLYECTPVHFDVHFVYMLCRPYLLERAKIFVSMSVSLFIQGKLPFKPKLLFAKCAIIHKTHNKAHLKRYTSAKHPVSPKVKTKPVHRCHDCDHTCSSKSKMDRHVSSHSRVACLKCTRKFKNQANLDKHMERDHAKLMKTSNSFFMIAGEDEIQTMEKWLYCQTCNYKAKHASVMKRHSKS